ncbi:MAG: hypothetical protein ACKVS6_10420, partial [Planctomycetota bacterium]
MEPRVKLNRNKSGYALVLAIVVLAALLTLATPFLLTTRSSARSSVARWGDVRARLEIDAAERALWRRLEATDPELDTTPYYDSEVEMRMRLSLPKELYPTREIGGSIVSATADPESARIDINTAGVYGLGLAFGHGLLGSDLKKDETEISLDNGDKFPDKGFLWIRGELIQYTEKKGSQFLGCTRSVMGSPTGPYEVAEDYRSGTPVVDARAHAIAKHRIRAKNGEFKTFSTIYELSRVNVEPDACPKITADDIRNVEARLTAYGERNGHDFWSAYARITSPIAADGIQRVLQIDLPRYFGVGTTVKIEGPEGVEYGLVVKSREDGITLEEPPRFPAAAYTAKISFLIPSPIHINSADPELLEDIFTGIDMERAATPEPVDRAAAKKIVQKIREKPVQSQQDFVDRVLLPLAEDGTLAINNIEAILRSVEHCNDRIVKYGTLPLSYTGGSRFRIVASSSVNAPSGAERGRVENESIVEIHPQARASSDIGLRLAARQVELDELFRLSRRGRGWMTYPYNSTPFDGRANPPSRARAFLNILTQLGESLPSVQSDDPANSWAQLAPSRDAVDPNFSEHFDYDLTIEGHDVRTLKPYRINPLNAPARLTGPGNVYLYPGSVSGWVRFDTGTVTGAIFDIGSGTSLLRDHISLIIDQGDLVATMRDPAGDDTNSLANVAGEVRNEIRYPVSNLQQNVWYHFTIAFKGSGPADWTLLVDGVPRGKRKLVTRLTGKLDGLTAQNIPNNDPIPVESTEGFPQFGVLKIGAELVEYTSITAKSFITTRTFGTSPGAYTGGRGARSSFDININPALYEHAEGETVEFYGYVNKLMRDTQAGGGQLRGTISKFSAGHVSITQPGLKPISIAPPVGGGGGGGGGITLGKGILATDTIPELVLAPLDVLETTGGGQSQDKDFIKAFSTAGGYAVMFQFQNPNTFSDGQTMFGAELIRYSGIDTSKSSLTGVTRAAQGNYFQPRTFV